MPSWPERWWTPMTSNEWRIVLLVCLAVPLCAIYVALVAAALQIMYPKKGRWDDDAYDI